MAHDYRLVQWTPFKKRFDAALAVGVVAFVSTFVAAAVMATPAGETLTPIQLAIRALGAAAFVLLHLILLIGPLARFWPRLLPLLYNRRHLGVTCFALAFTHGVLVTVWYHGFSDVNPLVSPIASNPRYAAIQGFPFESLGLAALAILFVMAATSHDFWNRNLGPATWKTIHMAVYPAYALLVAHVMLGAVQGEKGLIHAAATGAGALLVAGAHIAAGVRERKKDRAVDALLADGWIAVGPLDRIADGRATIVTPGKGEKIAVFRDGDAAYAISNVCRHQGGPLGEGRIIDGCVTCPWHGFQYRPQDGRAPPPYDERVAVYPVRLIDGAVFVLPEPAS